MMTTPHKHAALIKAWADGAVIEYYSPSRGGWFICTSTFTPEWDPAVNYRIKPEKKSPGEVLNEAFGHLRGNPGDWKAFTPSLQAWYEKAAQNFLTTMKEQDERN